MTEPSQTITLISSLLHTVSTQPDVCRTARAAEVDRGEHQNAASHSHHLFSYLPSTCVSAHVCFRLFLPSYHGADPVPSRCLRCVEQSVGQEELPAALPRRLHSAAGCTGRCLYQQPHLPAVLEEAQRPHDGSGWTDASSAHRLLFPTRRTPLCSHQPSFPSLNPSSLSHSLLFVLLPTPARIITPSPPPITPARQSSLPLLAHPRSYSPNSPSEL